MNWIEILKKLGELIHKEAGENMIYYDKGEIINNWLGYPPVSESEIQKKEDELNLKLPKSYKEFLRVTNGFKQISLFTGHLLPVQKIGWLKDLVPELYEVYEFEESKVSDEDYFNYSNSQDSVKFRVEYLLNSIVISENVEGSVILLNPQIKFENDWEAWIYASWYPGASRFKSFKELILRELKSTERLIKKK